MKIVHMVASLKGGGIQNLILSLVPEQVRLGHEVSVIVTDEDNLAYSNKNKEFLQNSGVSVYNLDRKVSDKISFSKHGSLQDVWWVNFILISLIRMGFIAIMHPHLLSLENLSSIAVQFIVRQKSGDGCQKS